MPTSTPSPLRCVVVDDNEINRLTLEHYISLTDSLELVASLPDARAALNLVRTAEPPIDVLFLDIEMPHLSGLELVPLLPSPAPEVVLVTSHPNFAVDAFELRVADYLVKPVEYGRFLKAVERAGTQRRNVLAALRSPAEPAPSAEGSADTDLFVKVNNKLVRLDFNDVLFIEAMSTYSMLVTERQKHIVYITLKALEERLPFANFRRVHRSYIVNTRRIDSVQDNMLQLGSYEVPIGKSYAEDFMRQLRGL
ncbi:response regulator transcription factor [Hymenobacter busanensis]|uniref:Response regulator transcription factor n=1 Tax=Hymenobacter busanensis TaxID=2607656 RepID=A0A7L5A2W3_9BACT|nr:LytTR family DNA-binding domain-containing protein [Hymenobacter busanensis]KAA9338190.1 response regulator transcription factor [Hymenobacter busanensis]QHJ09385.1 response regulator [Hymenobacter busanensis]